MIRGARRHWRVAADRKGQMARGIGRCPQVPPHGRGSSVRSDHHACGQAVDLHVIVPDRQPAHPMPADGRTGGDRGGQQPMIEHHAGNRVHRRTERAHRVVTTGADHVQRRHRGVAVGQPSRPQLSQNRQRVRRDPVTAGLVAGERVPIEHKHARAAPARSKGGRRSRRAGADDEHVVHATSLATNTRLDSRLGSP